MDVDERRLIEGQHSTFTALGWCLRAGILYDVFRHHEVGASIEDDEARMPVLLS